MESKFYDNNSDELIIFFTGWGCDNFQFEHLPSSRDLIILWDYATLDLNFNFKKEYKKVIMITYSAGVFAAGLVKDKLPKCDLKIAINGSPFIFDKEKGIDEHLFKVMSDLNLMNFEDFAKKHLVYDDEDYNKFMKHPAKRDFESSTKELNALFEYCKHNYSPMEYDIAILSDNDRIFNHEKQKEIFKNKYVVLKNAAHNAFSHFISFDEIIDFTKL